MKGNCDWPFHCIYWGLLGAFLFSCLGIWQLFGASCVVAAFGTIAYFDK